MQAVSPQVTLKHHLEGLYGGPAACDAGDRGLSSGWGTKSPRATERLNLSAIGRVYAAERETLRDAAETLSATPKTPTQPKK